MQAIIKPLVTTFLCLPNIKRKKRKMRNGSAWELDLRNCITVFPSYSQYLRSHMLHFLHHEYQWLVQKGTILHFYLKYKFIFIFKYF